VSPEQTCRQTNGGVPIFVFDEGPKVLRLEICATLETEKIMKAWIIKWNWLGDHATVDHPDVAILSARTSARKVREYVEVIYKTREYRLHEQLDQARYNKPQQNLYPAEFSGKWEGNIVCGHNPYLEAFLAEGINVGTDDEGNELLSYERITQERIRQKRLLSSTNRGAT
jgi:hypothetical protein